MAMRIETSHLSEADDAAVGEAIARANLQMADIKSLLPPPTRPILFFMRKVPFLWTVIIAADPHAPQRSKN